MIQENISLSKDAMKEVVKNKLEEFGAAENASKIKPSSLSIMASRYQSGELQFNNKLNE